MNELPFFDEKIDQKLRSSSVDNIEQDLRSAGNIAALLATDKINNKKARLLIEYFIVVLLLSSFLISTHCTDCLSFLIRENRHCIRLMHCTDT